MTEVSDDIKIQGEKLAKARTIGGGETFSTILTYAAELGYPNEEAFIQDLQGKVVLDLGSGRGGLAKDVALKDINCRIVSANPRLSRKGTRVDEKITTQEYISSVIPPPRPSLLERLLNRLGKAKKDNQQEVALKNTQRYHDQAAFAAYAHALPYKDNSFDLILDNQAVSKYAGYNPYETIGSEAEKQLFADAIREIVRVLKSGGQIRIGDFMGYGWETDWENDWKQMILKQQDLDYGVLWEDLRGKHIYPNLWGDKRALGVVITKH